MDSFLLYVSNVTEDYLVLFITSLIDFMYKQENYAWQGQNQYDDWSNMLNCSLYTSHINVSR